MSVCPESAARAFSLRCSASGTFLIWTNWHVTSMRACKSHVKDRALSDGHRVRTVGYESSLAILSCPRLTAHASGVAHAGSSGRLFGAPRRSRNLTIVS